MVVSIILTLILGFVTNLVQQSTNVRDTMTGVQQDQTAGEALLQYLHGTIVILPGSTATTLNASILAGVNSTSVPQTATLKSVLTPSSNPKFDATFTTSLSPDGVHYSNVSTYDAVNSSNVFTYWYNNYNVTPVTLASTTAPTNAELSEIVAVGIDVTFLAGPQVPTRGFAVRATSFQTTIYLQNASGAPAPTTSVSVARHLERDVRRRLARHADGHRQPSARRRNRDLHRDPRRDSAVDVHGTCRREHDGRDRRLLQ